MEPFFRKLGIFIENKRLVVVIISLMLIVASLFGAMQLTMATGTETMISTDSQVYQDYERFNQHFGSSVIVVLVTGDDITQLLQPDNVRAMETIESQMGANPRVISAIGPAFLIKQAVAQQTGTPALPDDPRALQAIVIDPQSGQVRPQLESILPDDKHALIAITLEGGLSGDEEKEVVEEVEEAVATAGFVGVEPVVTGTPTITSHVKDSMTSSMRNMFIVAIFPMLLILALIFSVRGFFAWRWLLLSMVAIGVVYTFGAMGVLSVPLTIVTMAVFPILIGLGVDYAIQFHNRYDEETRRGETVAEAIIDSVTHIGPAIGIALIVACLGFAALFFSPVPMIQDFGRMLIIGVIACYLVSMFLLLAVLYWHDRRTPSKAPASKGKDKPKRERVGLVERGLHRLAPWVIKKPAIIIPIALVLTAGGLITDSYIETETDISQFLSPDLPVMQDLRTLEAVAGGQTSVNLLVEAEDITDPAILAWMLQLERRVGTEQAAAAVSTSSVADLVLQATGGQMPQSSQQVRQVMENLPAPIRKNLVSDDYTAANIVLSTRETSIDQIRELKAQLTDYTADCPAGVNVAITGMSIVQIELLEALSGGRVKMTLIGIGFVFLGLFLLFRFSVLRAFMATLPIGLIIGWSSGLMYLSGIKYTPLTATLGALIIGIGVEYTIMLMMRYYEERGKGERPVEAMTTAMTKIGRAVIASALTTIGGFGALLIAKDFVILRDFGIVTTINVFFALVSTLFVLPTLIVWINSWREKHRLARRTV